MLIIQKYFTTCAWNRIKFSMKYDGLKACTNYKYREAINDRFMVAVVTKYIYLFKASEFRISYVVMS